MARDNNSAGWLAVFLGAASGLVAMSWLASKPGKVVDLRDAAAGVKYGRRAGSLFGKVKRTFRHRDVRNVNSITLHQWGVTRVGTRAHRKVTAHLSVGHDGTVYYVHPFGTWLAASHGLNGRSVSIEVAGLYGRDSVVPAPIIEGTRRAIEFARGELAREGGDLTTIYAHRQSSSGRAMDPGPDLWARAAVPSGLITRPEFTTGTGKPIPSWWYPGVDRPTRKPRSPRGVA